MGTREAPLPGIVVAAYALCALAGALFSFSVGLVASGRAPGGGDAGNAFWAAVGLAVGANVLMRIAHSRAREARAS